jgi:YVTN family beta-propeller protein
MKASHLKYAIPVVALALAPLTASASTVRIYITNSAGDTVDVIDPASNTVVQEIKDVVGAHGVNFSPDGSRVYISNELTQTLDVYDREAATLIKKVELSGHPNNIAVTKNGDRIVVAVAHGQGGLDIVDAGTLTLKTTISTDGGRLHNVYVTPDGKYVIGGSIPARKLYVFDLATEQLAWDLQMDLGIRPMAIEANPDGSTKRIFVQLSQLNGFAVVDFAARKEVARINLPEPSPRYDDGGYRTNEPSHGISVAPDNKTLWVTSIPNNAVYAYALDTLKEIGHVDLPSLRVSGKEMPISAVANWTTFTPDGKYLYISNAGMRSVSVIDVADMKLVKAVPVGEVPKRSNTLVVPDGDPGKRASLH